LLPVLILGTYDNNSLCVYILIISPITAGWVLYRR